MATDATRRTVKFLYIRFRVKALALVKLVWGTSRAVVKSLPIEIRCFFSTVPSSDSTPFIELQSD